MTKIKRWRLILAATLAAFFAVTLGFALHLSARSVSAAEDATVTVYTTEGGTVSWNGQTSGSNAGDSITVTDASGSTVSLVATANEGYIFGYWTQYNTSYKYDKSACYDETYEYSMSATNQNITAQFFKKEEVTGGKYVYSVGDGFQQQAGESKTDLSDHKYFYDLFSDPKNTTANDQNSKPASQIVIDYYGDMYLNFTYIFPSHSWDHFYLEDNYTGTSSLNRGMQDDITGTSSIQQDDLSKEEMWTKKVWNPAGDRFHHVVLYVYENNSVNGEGGLEQFYIKNFELIPHERLATQPLVFGDVPDGGNVTVNGVKVEKNTTYYYAVGEEVTIQLNNNMAISSIDPEQQVLYEVDGLYPIEGEKSQMVIDEDKFTRSGYTTGDKSVDDGYYQYWTFTFDQDGKFSHKFLYSSGPWGYPDGDNQWHTEYCKGGKLEVKYIEHMPKAVTKLVRTIAGQSQSEEPVTEGTPIELEFGVSNSLMFTFEPFANQEANHINVQYEVNKIDSKGTTPISVIDDNKKGFTLTEVQENTTIQIKAKDEDGVYGDSYIFTIDIAMVSPEGIQKIVNPAFELPITNSNDYAWFFDPANNGETFAYKAGNANNQEYTRKLSQIKIDVSNYNTKAGQLKFEFKIDGYGNGTERYAQAAYNIDAPVTIKTSPYPFSVDAGTTFAQANSTQGEQYGTTLWRDAILSNGAQKLEGEGVNTWYSMAVSVEAGKNAVYIAYFDYYGYKYPIDGFVIRNVMFLQGDATMAWGIKNADNESVDDGSLGTISVTKGANEAATAGTMDIGSALTFKANPDESKHFYGWVDEEGQILSTELSFKYTVSKNASVYALIDDEGTYAVRSDGKFYKDTEIETAFTAASTGKDKNVILVDNATLSGITVPAGVNLVIPFNRAGDYYAMGTAATATSGISWAGGTYAQPVYKLTLEGENVINGTLTVGGVLHYPDQSAQGHTSGAYTQLILQDADTKVTVGQGGHLDVYGRVTGEGSIDVTKGGKLSQPFMITDYNGGTNTEASFNKNVTPFKMYAMVNVQNKGGFTIHHGAELYGHASLYFLSSITTIEQPFISYVNRHEGGMDYFENNALIVLNDDASAHIVYDDSHKRPDMGDKNNAQDVGKTTIEISGNAYADFMQFPLGINTTKVYFSIPYNYEITLKSGNFDILYPYKAMPGSVLTVESGATLNVRGTAGLHVYDSFAIPNVDKRTYPTGTQLKNADYLPYASLIVNGTLNLQDGATFLGTVQTTDTTGNAKIVVGEDVKLSDDTLFDGVETEYSCNYTKYALEAHVWDKVHKELRPLVAGNTYTSTYADGDTFTLPGITFQIESKTGKHVGEAHTLTESVTESVDGLKGAWKVEHEHTYDWTPKDEEKSESIFRGNNSVELERGCLELGCDEVEKKVLFKNIEKFNSKTYRGTAFTGAELFEELYPGRIAAAGVTFTVDGDREVKGVGTYTFTAAAENGYFLVNGEFVASHDFTFVINKKDVTVSVLDQTSTYSGNEPDAAQGQGGYTVSGLCENDVLGIVIEKQPGAAAGEYHLTATANGGSNENANDNYNISFSYTGSGYSTYTVEKATLTIKPRNVSSPAGEEPVTDFTATISGFVNGEREALEADILKALVYNCAVTKDSPSGRQFEITVTFTGTLQNYEVTCTRGIYTVTESLFKDVKFKDDVVTYDGAEHSLSVTGMDGLGEGSSVEYAPANSYKNAGTYTITATVTAKDSAGKTYTQTFEATLTIERRTVTVDLVAQSKGYDGMSASAQSRAGTDWKLAEGSAMGAGDELSALGVTLSVTAPAKNVGTYAIAAEASVNDQENGNYTVIFSNNNANLYTIAKRDLHITVTGKATVYGESIDLDQTAWTYDNDTDFIAGDLIHVTLSSDVEKNAGNYHITASADAALDDNKNYNFLFTDAAWTISPKAITVVITPVTVTYSGQEPAAPTLWELKAGSELVAGDEKSALNIRLTKAAGVNAGSYDINATYDNGNYTVTFEGGKGGYTVNKYDIGDAGDFFLMAGDESSTSGTFTLRYAGQPIELVGYVIFGEIVDLKVVLSLSSLTEIGEYDVTASVDDTNYSGSRTFRVIVVNGNGYTKHLVDTLAQLAALTDGMTAETLTAEDFGALKQVTALIAALDESEREMGKDALAPYESLVAAWNDAVADIDAKVETAESIQNALLGGLFGAAATLGLLLAAAYVVGKGGIL